MQYADIALSVRTQSRQSVFTYQIPPALLPDIRVGQRVYVPFRGRELIGTIIGLRLKAPYVKGMIRPINGLVDPLPLFSQKSLDWLQQVATHYAATIGQVLTDAAPQPAKRTAKRLNKVEVPIEPPKVQSGQRYGLYQPIHDRYQTYLNLIERAIESKSLSQVLFPSQELAADFTKYLREQGVETVLIPSTQEITEHYTTWLKAYEPNISVIVGTRKTVFLSPPNIRLLIIDSASEYGYKEEQFPYYHVVTVAKLKAQSLGCHVVIADAAPRLQEWYERQHNQLQLLPNPSPQPEVTILDSTGQRGLLPDILIERIKETANRGGQVALFYNRKGSGRLYHCLECETAFYCPRCDNLLGVRENSEQITLFCSNCSYTMKPPYRCPVCSSYKLGSQGWGIDALANRVRELLPDLSVDTIESDKSIASANLPNILIGTRQLLYLAPSIRFDLIVALRFDHQLHGSDWLTGEQAFLTLHRLAERGKSIMIQTSEPEHPIITAFTQQKPELYYQEELKQRANSNYPPIGSLIRLTTRGPEAASTLEKATLLHRQLAVYFKDQPNRLFAPSQVGSGKRRDKHRYQIIIKSPLTTELLKLIPTDWQIDPEPLELQ